MGLNSFQSFEYVDINMLLLDQLSDYTKTMYDLQENNQQRPSYK
jgi:hypothetical protein